MDAQERTKNLLRLDEVPLSLFDKNEHNPNRMSNREFDLLCDNMQKTGFTDPILSRPQDVKALRKIAKQAGDKPGALVAAMVKNNCRLRIVGGHHRFDAASFLGFDAGPTTVIMDESFDLDAENFQLVRMNTIRGRIDPQSFFTLVGSLSEKYTDEVLQDAFGFAEEAEFKRLLQQTSKSLTDPAMKKKFNEAAKEIKTIDGLAKVLNSLFTKYGDTVPYGFMVFDYGGKESMWLRVESKTLGSLKAIGQICIENRRTVDDVIGRVVQLIAHGDLTDVLKKIVDETDEVDIPEGIQVAPTKNNLEQIEAAA